MTSNHTTTPAMGTAMYLLTPKSSMPAAMPANSESVAAPLSMSTAIMARAVKRTPNCSRMSDASPLPVTAPMREAPSWTMASITIMMGMIHRVP